jgi:hypothetical protein
LEFLPGGIQGAKIIIIGINIAPLFFDYFEHLRTAVTGSTAKSCQKLFSMVAWNYFGKAKVDEDNFI